MGPRRSTRTGGIGRAGALPSIWVQLAGILRGSRSRDRRSVTPEPSVAFLVGLVVGALLAAAIVGVLLVLFILFLALRWMTLSVAAFVNRRAVARALADRAEFVVLAEEHFAPTDEEIRRWAAQVQGLSPPLRVRRAGAIRVHLDCPDGRMRYRVGGPRWAEPAVKQAAWAGARLVPLTDAALGEVSA
ncbi:MAG: hypothetical protein ACRDJF_00435 [Actinomycetota bacterium]